MKIERKRGDTYPVKITVKDKQGVAISLTSETFQLSVASEENPVGAPDILSVAGTITDAPNGKVSFAIDGTQDVGTYYYDIEMVDTLSQKRTIAKDVYKVKQDITK